MMATPKPAPLSLLAELVDGRGAVDPTDAERFLAQRVARARPEAWLAFEVLVRAIEDANAAPIGPRDARRDAARAWLCDDAQSYSARLCCEALNIDYELLRERVTRGWRSGS